MAPETHGIVTDLQPAKRSFQEGGLRATLPTPQPPVGKRTMHWLVGADADTESLLRELLNPPRFDNS
jgi:hypothetical protein